MREQPSNPRRSMSNRIAPPGMVWRCRHCGKRSLDEYGDRRIDRGYDESCVLNAELVDEAEAMTEQEWDRATGKATGDT